MSEVEASAEIKVPPQWVPFFRRAIAEEIKLTAEGIVDDSVAVDRFVVNGGKDDADEFEFRSSARLCMADVALLEQVAGNTANGAQKIMGAPDTLAHVCESMARQLAPKVAEEVCTSPLDADAGEVIHGVLDPLTWAVIEAQRLHGEWEADRRETMAV